MTGLLGPILFKNVMLTFKYVSLKELRLYFLMINDYNLRYYFVIEMSPWNTQEYYNVNW